MNLKHIKDSNITGTFTVGNLNDYLNVINRTNYLENSKLSIDSFQSLEDEYPNETLSYKVTSKDEKALVSLQINGEMYLNVYK